MKVTGIITEYNPFHNGHKYQIDTLKRQLAPDFIIIAMGGNFMQRGTPSFLDKYTRAKMALQQGADLVIELPVCYATSSAAAFARGGIALLAATGLTDTLCFGAECPSLPRLEALCELLLAEPDWYQKSLTSYLREGLSFPAARAKALPEYEDVLNSPNNILALEYLKAIRQTNASLAPYLIRREGSSYHDTDYLAPLASASAIRTSIQNGGSIDSVLAAVPSITYAIMKEYEQNAAFLDENDFSLLLHHCLLQQDASSLLAYEDFTTSLANRIYNCRKEFLSWSSFCETVKTKDTTYARISRLLCHLLLNLKSKNCAEYYSLTTLPYLRILGFKKSAALLLSHLKQCALAPILTTPANPQSLSSIGQEMLKVDIYAADLYRSVLTAKKNKSFPNEYQRKMIVIE